jgi:hypothetical protein
MGPKLTNFKSILLGPLGSAHTVHSPSIPSIPLDPYYDKQSDH